MPPPNRWEPYSPLGKVISGTNLIAFKVPLKEVLLDSISEDQWFTPSILIKQTKDEGINLGLVVDLTYTTRYYNPIEFTKQGILHKKIFTQGHVVPSNKVYAQFATVLKDFDKKDHVIGVHCTHGVSRTGYLICRYMIEELKFEPQTAIDAFASARGHAIERENYLEDLKMRIPGEITPVGEAENEQEEKQAWQGWKKPRWRHNRQDHPGWRERRPEPTENQNTDYDTTGRHSAIDYNGDVHNSAHYDKRYARQESAHYDSRSTRNYGGHHHQGHNSWNRTMVNRGRGFNSDYQDGNRGRAYSRRPYRGSQGRGYHSWNNDTSHQSWRHDHDTGYHSRNNDTRYPSWN